MNKNQLQYLDADTQLQQLDDRYYLIHKGSYVCCSFSSIDRAVNYYMKEFF